MAGRYDFQSRFGGGEDPWFRVGGIDVTTVTAIVGLALIQVLVHVIEGTSNAISKWFILVPSLVTGGEVWRIVTWPFMTYLGGPGLIWTLLLVAIFWLWGSQLERIVGRREFLAFFALLVLGPALLLVLLSLFMNLESLTAGLRYPELGVLAAFAAQFPTARFWPGIPAPILAGLIIGIQLIEDLADRDSAGLVMLVTSVSLGLLGIRALGHASEVEWIPKLSIPGLTPSGAPRAARSARPSRSRKSSNRAGLRAVPAPPAATPRPAESSAEIDALLDKIAESGYDSLTKPEKARLEAHSKQMRRRNE